MQSSTSIPLKFMFLNSKENPITIHIIEKVVEIKKKNQIIWIYLTTQAPAAIFP